MKYIDSEKLIAEIERRKKELLEQAVEFGTFESNRVGLYDNVELYDDLLSFINSLQQEQPDKETILRVCKLHKAWSIIAPWENIEDFITANWNSENVV